MKKIIFFIILLILLAVGLTALHLFVIGDPVDGNSLIVDVEELEKQINIHISTSSSATAFSDISFRHDGSVMHITVRKVLVSSLHRSGTTCISIEKNDETAIWLGGRLIWSAEQI